MNDQLEITKAVLAKKKEVLAELNAMLLDLQQSGLNSPNTITICRVHRDSTITWIEDLEKQLAELEKAAHP